MRRLCINLVKISAFWAESQMALQRADIIIGDIRTSGQKLALVASATSKL